MENNSVRLAAEYCDSIFEKSSQLFPAFESKALVLDMTTCTFSEFSIPEKWCKSYVSGTAMAARIWAYYSNEEDSNPVVISCPVSQSGNIISVCFKSPATDRICFNTVSSSIAQRIKKCGYNAIVIKGYCNKYQKVEISSLKADFSLAEDLYGKTVSQIKHNLKLSEKSSFFVTGISGDCGVKTATCICDDLLTGRGGLGSVLGAKHLKAIIVNSNEITQTQTNDFSFSYMNAAVKRGWVPVNNFTGRTDQRLYHLSVTEFARLDKKNSIEKEQPPFFAILMLGSNCGCYDSQLVRKRYEACVEYALDPVSVGCILGNEIKHLKDQDEVLGFIEGLARIDYNGDCYNIKGLEVGPFDYRGNFAQAISDSGGNTFNLFFNSNPGLAVNHFAYWTFVGEVLNYGLNSCGFSTTRLEKKAFKTGRIRQLILKVFYKNANRYFLPNKEALLISMDMKVQLNSKEIVKLGKRCSRLILEINKALCGELKYDIPDYFKINPESNFAKGEVVPMHNLVWEYFKLLSKDYN